MHDTDAEIMALSVEVIAWEDFSPSVMEKIEVAFWSGALISSDVYVLSGEEPELLLDEDPESCRDISASLLEWEGNNYYVLRIRDDSGFFPSDDVVSSFYDFTYGYAFFTNLADLRKGIGLEEKLLGHLTMSLLPERDLSVLSDEKLAKLGARS